MIRHAIMFGMVGVVMGSVGVAYAVPKPRPSDTPIGRSASIAAIPTLDIAVLREFEKNITAEIGDADDRMAAAAAELKKLREYSSLKENDAIRVAIEKRYSGKDTCDCTPKNQCTVQVLVAAGAITEAETVTKEIKSADANGAPLKIVDLRDNVDREAVCQKVYAAWQAREKRTYSIPTGCLAAVNKCGPILQKIDLKKAEEEVGESKAFRYLLGRQLETVVALIKLQPVPMKVGEQTTVAADPSTATQIAAKRRELIQIAKDLDRADRLAKKEAPAN